MFCFLYMLSFFFVMNGDDWFMIWMGLEINMMSFIMMIYKSLDRKIMESCLKYFFIQSIGSAIFMGTFYMDDVILSGLIILVLSYKIGSGPFYFWFPSMCMSISWVACFLLMSFQKVMPLVLMMLVVSVTLKWVLLMSLVIGSWGSFNQVNIKALFAYSSIHHVGWMLLCSFLSDVVWLIYLCMYSFMVICMIILFSEYEISYLFSVSKWGSKMWFVIGMMSMSGIPPLLGFFLKWMAFMLILKMDMFYVVLMILMTFIMFYVYFRVIYDMIMYIMVINCNSVYVNMVDINFKEDYFNMVGMFMGFCLVLFLF